MGQEKEMDMFAMTMFLLLGLAALVSTGVRLYKRNVSGALGSLGVFLVVTGLFFYTMSWRDRAYEVIGEEMPFMVVAAAEVYDTLLLLGVGLVGASGVMYLLHGRNKVPKQKTTTAPTRDLVGSREQ